MTDQVAESPSALLRRASERMREVALAAVTTVDDQCQPIDPPTPWHRAHEVARRLWTSQSRAEHIAAWHPAVALAVADWLDETARELDEVTAFHGGDYEPGPHFQSALSVACTFLGE